MELLGVIIALQIVNAYSAAEILVQENHNDLHIAAANIVDRCFASSDSRSELLIISHYASHENLGKIYQGSETSNSIVFLDSENDAEFEQPGKCNDYLNGVEWQERNPVAAMVIARDLKHLESILSFLKTSKQSIWKPGAYFLVVLEAGCDVGACNDMLKVMWEYWVLNVVILCPSDGLNDSNQSEFDLYTFNPYSAVHSRQWETIIYETVEVSIDTGKFNHSWYIFKQRFTDSESSEYCGDLFFDKTSNLDGYVIPIDYNFPEFLMNTTNSIASKFFLSDRHLLNTIARQMRFNVAKLQTNDPELYGGMYENGTYYGIPQYIYEGRMHLAPGRSAIAYFPGMQFTYPHDVITDCFMSRIVGFRPRWSNLADAKPIWIALGLGLIFSAVFFYLQNRSHGIVSAMLDAQRLIIGSSVIHTCETIKYKIILGSILLVVLVVDGAIRGRFISILTVVSPYPNFDTIEQLIESNVDVYTDVHYKVKAIIYNDKVRIKDKVNMLDCTKALQRSARNQRACFSDCLALKIMTASSSIIHLSSAPVENIYVTYVYTMHWPVGDRYNSMIQILVEAGIVGKWNSDLRRWLEVDGWKLRRAAEPPYIRPTKLEDLLPAVIVLSVGLSAALIVFAWEIKFGKSRRSVKPQASSFVLL